MVHQNFFDNEMLEGYNNFVMDKPYPGERRQYPRLNTAVDVVYVVEKGRREDDEVISKNISAGGICLILYENVAIDTLLSLEINLPSKTATIKAIGRVRWVKEFAFDSDEQLRYDAGIEFTKINEANRNKIAQYVFSVR